MNQIEDWTGGRQLKGGCICLLTCGALFVLNKYPRAFCEAVLCASMLELPVLGAGTHALALTGFMNIKLSSDSLV